MWCIFYLDGSANVKNGRNSVNFYSFIQETICQFSSTNSSSPFYQSGNILQHCNKAVDQEQTAPYELPQYPIEEIEERHKLQRQLSHK